ncbi:unnamed protein product [Mytilus edulis]|uniref:Uncharacterized protein n=1 Tax=Mytilus edulis TaxID=6550 RepID=A0A8S3RJW8_MYTED|nr:unnamed protein product [Mytilus edulis]
MKTTFPVNLRNSVRNRLTSEFCCTTGSTVCTSDTCASGNEEDVIRSNEDDGSSPAVTREAIKAAVDSLLRSRNEKNPISTTPLVAAKPQQTSYEYDSQKVQQQPCENQSQQNESCVPVTQLSQQNKWHDIPVHQQLSQKNPLQIPLLILRESY